MKILLLLLSLCCGSAFAQTNSHYSQSGYDIQHPKPEKKTVLVYVCNSSKAYRYHSRETCSGYQHCKHTESQIDIEEAKRRGYTPCQICKP